MPFIQKHRMLAMALVIAAANVQHVQARGDMPPGDSQGSYKPYYPQLPGIEPSPQPSKPIPAPDHFYLASKATTYNGLQLAQGIDTSLESLRKSADLTAAQKNQLRELELALGSRAPAELGAALEQLAGSQHANLLGATQKTSDQISASLLSAMLDAPNQDEGRFWVQGLGSDSTLDGPGSGSGMKQGQQGLLIGSDWELDYAWRLGVVGGRSSSNLDARRFNATLDSWHLGAYAVRQDGPLALRLGAIHSRHDGQNRRSVDIDFLDYKQQLKGRYTAQSQNAFAEMGYTLGNGAFSAEPFASLGYQRYQRAAFKETGGDAALNVGAQTQENLSSTLGVRLVTHYRFDNQMSLTPYLETHWKHLYGDVGSRVHQSSRLIRLDGMDAATSNFTIQGTSLDRDTLGLRAGLDLALSAQQTVGLSYTAHAASNSRGQGLVGQWQMGF